MSTQPDDRQISKYLDIQTDVPERAELAFIFGTRHPDPAQMALDLLKDKVVRYVVLTGGPNRLTGTNEGQAHLKTLLAGGAPPRQLIIEGSSTNTLENVLHARPIIDQQIGLKNVQSIIVLTKWYHIRRAMMTLKRHFPDGIRYYALTYNPPGIHPEDWRGHTIARQRVLKEWDSIPRYLAKGDIAEIQPIGIAYV